MATHLVKNDFLILAEKDLLEEESALTELLKLMLTESNSKDLPLTKVFDPREGLTIDDSMTKKYDEKLDQALEVWAQAELDIIRVCQIIMTFYCILICSCKVSHELVG